MDTNDLNKRLSLITFITSIGDFISLFAIIQFLSDRTQNVLIASAAIPAKSVGILIAGLIIPSVCNRWDSRRILVGTQFISFLLMVAVYYFVNLNSDHSWIFLLLVCLQMVMKQTFDAVRETLSKKIGTIKTHRGLQAQLLQGLYGAQFIGPVASYFLVINLGVKIPLLIDATTFLLAAILSIFLPAERIINQRLSIIKPLTYLKTNNPLMRIFVIRTLGTWIPIGIFNYAIFSVVEKHYNLGLVNSAWVYTAIGFGSLLATTALQNRNWNWLREMDDQKILFFGFFSLALTRIGFLELKSFFIAFLLLVGGGVCNGLNMTASQSLRRKLTSDSEFAEVVSLELIIAKVVDVSTAGVCGFALSNNLLSYQNVIWLSAGSLMLVALLYQHSDFATEKILNRSPK